MGRAWQGTASDAKNISRLETDTPEPEVSKWIGVVPNNRQTIESDIVFLNVWLDGLFFERNAQRIASSR